MHNRLKKDAKIVEASENIPLKTITLLYRVGS